MIRRIKHWYYQRKIKATIKILRNLDETMTMAGWSRHERKQFWRDFIKDRMQVVEFFNRAASTGDGVSK